MHITHICFNPTPWRDHFTSFHWQGGSELHQWPSHLCKAHPHTTHKPQGVSTHSHMGVSKNRGGVYPQIMNFHTVSPLFSPSILVYCTPICFNNHKGHQGKMPWDDESAWRKVHGYHLWSTSTTIRYTLHIDKRHLLPGSNFASWGPPLHPGEVGIFTESSLRSLVISLVRYRLFLSNDKVSLMMSFLAMRKRKKTLIQHVLETNPFIFSVPKYKFFTNILSNHGPCYSNKSTYPWCRCTSGYPSSWYHHGKQETWELQFNKWRPCNACCSPGFPVLFEAGYVFSSTSFRFLE